MRDNALIVFGLVGWLVLLMVLSLIAPPCQPGEQRTTNGTSACIHRGK